MDRFCRGLSLGEKSSSNRNKKSVISEKSLKDWKLPASSASDIYNKRAGIFSTVRTVEKEIRLSEVALKPTKLGSNTTAVICLADNRLTDEYSVLKVVKSSLHDGPIYFSYFPTGFVSSEDAHGSYTINIATKGSNIYMRGGESMILMYRIHYEVTNAIFPNLKNMTISYSLVTPSNSPSSDGEESAVAVAVANACLDWKETAEAHVLKVDVPGLKKEEVKVEVEDDGCTLKISGERSNEQEENGDMWHCVERSSGKFLRRVTLPENAKLDEVDVAMENGVLTLTVPKKKLKPRRKPRRRSRRKRRSEGD